MQRTKYMLVLALLVSTGNHPASTVTITATPGGNSPNNVSNKLITAGICAGACAASYVATRTWAHAIVGTVQARFTPLFELLAQYAQWAEHHGWSIQDDANLRTQLYQHITHLHNSFRDSWRVTVLYELLHERPAVSVDNHYYTFPLLQCLDDINAYLWRLRVISVAHLYSDRARLDYMIRSLQYIRDMIHADPEYNRQEREYARMHG